MAHKIRFLTYNVRMLPGITGDGKSDLARCRQIAKRLRRTRGAFDVICLQEVFDEDARKILIDALGESHPYQVPLCEDDGFLNQDSGLFFASKIPIDEDGSAWRFREYGESSGFFSADYWVDKGVFVARLAAPGGVRVLVANTHMQSDAYEVGVHAAVRAKQLREARRVLARALLHAGAGSEAASQRELAARSVAIFLGDFNVPGEDRLADGSLVAGPEYVNLRRELAWGRDAYRELHPESPGWTWCGAGKRASRESSDETRLRLDYAFVFDAVPIQRAAEPPRLRPTTIERVSIETFQPAGQASLSDHYGLSVQISY